MLRHCLATRHLPPPRSVASDRPRTSTGRPHNFVRAIVIFPITTSQSFFLPTHHVHLPPIYSSSSLLSPRCTCSRSIHPPGPTNPTRNCRPDQPALPHSSSHHPFLSRAVPPGHAFLVVYHFDRETVSSRREDIGAGEPPGEQSLSYRCWANRRVTIAGLWTFIFILSVSLSSAPRYFWRLYVIF